jgi:hypothetical protein
MGAFLSDVAEDQTYDELDACAYQILAALFSVVEPELQQSLRTFFQKLAATKIRKDALLGIYDDVRAVKWAFSDEVVKNVLTNLVFAKRGMDELVGRIFNNSQFHTLWQNAFLGPREDFIRAIASAAAAIVMGNLPGDQCIAVVRAGGRLYVTANGLWASGQELAETPDPIDYAGDAGRMLNRPWFPSARQCEVALNLVAPDILVEYHARSLVFVNPMQGDFGGKYHAEMQLMEYMFDHQLLCDRGYMGVSKPCCNFCQTRLDPAGIKFWNRHNVRGNDPLASVDGSYTTFATAERLGDFRRALQGVQFYGLIVPT